MKKGVKIIAYISLALFVTVSVGIQMLSLQNNNSSGILSNSLSKKIVSLFYGDQNTKTDTEHVSIESITISKTTAGDVCAVGSVTELKTAITPSNATEKVKYYSSDKNVATVNSNGKIEFKAAGNVSVYATDEDGAVTSNTLTFNVEKEFEITDLDLSLFSIVAIDNSDFDVLKINEVKSITYKYNGEPLPLNEIKITTSNSSVIELSQRSVVQMLAKKAGTATIKIFYEDTELCRKTVNVSQEVLSAPVIESLEINENSSKDITLELGEIYNMNIVLTDADNQATALVFKLKNTQGEPIISLAYKDNASKFLVKTTHLGSEVICVYPFFDQETPIYEFNLKVLPKKPVIWGVNAPTEVYVNQQYSFKLVAADPDSLYGWSCSCDSPYAQIDENGRISFSQTGKYDITYRSQYYPEDEYVYVFTVIVKNENYLIVFRKGLGHAGIFLALGVFATISFGILIKKKVFSALFITMMGLFNALLSEIFQLPCFTSGRSARLIDVSIDFSGYLVGFIATFALCCISYFIILFIKRKLLKRNKPNAQKAEKNQ